MALKPKKVVVMCLAKTYFASPNFTTADKLIQDKLAMLILTAQGGSESLVGMPATWGLMLTGKIVNLAEEERSKRFL